MSTDKKIREALAVAASEYVTRVEWAMRNCESPIEKLLFVEMLLELDEHDCVCCCRRISMPEYHECEKARRPHGEILDVACPVAIYDDERGISRAVYSQLRVDLDGRGCRLDFAIIGDGYKIAIECDGHEYHERTKEQAARDRSRDRSLTELGWLVLRFTGSEIHKDASKCAEQVRVICERKDAKRFEP